MPDTTFTYHPASTNFRLNIIQHGTTSDAFPDFTYTAANYDAAGNLKGMSVKINSATETYAFGYDDLNRLTAASLTGASTANFSYTYAYDLLGNITGRTGTVPAMSYTYTDPAHIQAVTQITGGVDFTYTYDSRGNLETKKTGSITTHNYSFDVENRLKSVTTGGQTTAFEYDADGQRVKTAYPDGTIIYTPFPDYEITDPPGTGANTLRTTYRLAGQIVAVKTRTGTSGTGKLYFTLTDHLGNIAGLGEGSTFTSGSLARLDPFGNYRTTPSTNPTVTNQGYTGHRHNNTGTYDLGLIYMNARYYLPEVGRFISPDTLVPDPGNPQSHNRYAYVLNSPVNYTDPSGHREIGADENDLLPHEAPFPTLSEKLSSTGPLFDGLPVQNVKWAQGFGATEYAAKYGDPNSKYYNSSNPTYRNSAGLHAGIDFGADPNSDVYSTVYGRLLFPPPFPGDAGPNVIVQLENGMMVIYGHVSAATGLTDGMEVWPGMLIGTVVDQASRSHVHLSLREGSRTYNPAFFFTDPSTINMLPYSDYVPGENLHSISSFLYQSPKNPYNYWTDGDRRVGVWR